MLRSFHRLLTQFDDALDWLEDDPLLTPCEPTSDWGDGEFRAASEGPGLAGAAR
ncbi:MAG: hypothetical protein M3527_02085 [Actinomycetota bacterium]|nr:hypothetical protein [Acidimicrobiia bacterium]MDQ3293232.1 hypothetical protein [Actinomycetota bacterium]